MRIADVVARSIASVCSHRLAAELVVLAVIGLLMGILQPFGSGAAPLPLRYAYWLICIVAGGAVGIACDGILGRWPLPLWQRVVASSLAMTLPVVLIVLAADRILFDHHVSPAEIGASLWQVFVVCIAVMTVRSLVWRRPTTVIETRTTVETRTVVQAPLPTATAIFRQRLSAKRRGSRLIAIEAQDHYLRVHTDLGEELVTMRFTDALEELSLAHGYHVHRSWWIAADAIDSVKWDRGSGRARLAGAIEAPVSRQRAFVLREAGW